MGDRATKYANKISGDVAKNRYDATKELSVKQEKIATEDLVKIEKQVKEMLSGVSTIQLPYYIIFAKEIYRVLKTHTDITAANEICILANKWYTRGLDATYLNSITSFYSGGKIVCIMACDYPDESNVVDGVVYASGTMTGEYVCVLGLPRTGYKTSLSDYDDGYYEAGLPAGAGVRFIDNGDGTISDAVTGLMWIKDGNGAGCNNGSTITWTDALTFCHGLTFAGVSDWRLPNIKELMSIANYEAANPSIDQPPFTNTKSSPYWSSTPDSGYYLGAIYVEFGFGIISGNLQATPEYIRPVRGGQINP